MNFNDISQKRVPYMKSIAKRSTSQSTRKTRNMILPTEELYETQHNYTIQNFNDSEFAAHEDGEEVEFLDDEEDTSITQTASAGNQNDSKLFYPNAIHCLLALYRHEYQRSKSKGEPLLSSGIWHRVSIEMNESFFEFDEEQIKRKYIELRTQYLNLSSLEDINAFEYFEQMHDIYRDARIDAIVNGRVSGMEARRHSLEKYFDDNLFAVDQEKPQEVIIRTVYELEDEESAEFAEKASESIEIIKQEIEEIVENAPHLDVVNEVTVDLSNPHPAKRAKLHANKEDPLQINPVANSDCRSTEEVQSEPTKVDMTLSEFNNQQERRHQELREDLHHLMRLQEKSIDLQTQLMQKINRHG